RRQRASLRHGRDPLDPLGGGLVGGERRRRGARQHLRGAVGAARRRTGRGGRHDDRGRLPGALLARRGRGAPARRLGRFGVGVRRPAGAVGRDPDRGGLARGRPAARGVTVGGVTVGGVTARGVTVRVLSVRTPRGRRPPGDRPDGRVLVPLG